MFTVGEFARIAQVSKRLLRYYDEIGLLKPLHTERFTGYRYYSAEQLSHLNRILALRDLGLSLEQIQEMLKENVATEEIQRMLLLKQAEIEQQVQRDLQRLHRIATRLQVIRSTAADHSVNVVLKQTPAQPVLSVRTKIETFETGLSIFEQISATLSEKGIYGFRFCICYDDETVERNMDLEMGHLLLATSHAPVLLPGGLQLRFRELPAATTMATLVVKGGLENIHTGYTEIGLWIDANGYRLAGPPREISLQAPQAADGSDLVTEIQFPVEAAP